MTETTPTVAYFCMEYGLDHALPIYSGGLGVLAGDMMKSAGDLKLPVIGIGLLWGEGYTTQLINDEGKPEDHYVATPREALVPVDGIEVEVRIGGKRVPLRAFAVDRYLSSRLYLLEPDHEEDRWITRRLYGGGQEDRIAQEICLGVGGIRLLRALGLEVDVYHFNEGHAVFAGLELVRERRAEGLGVEDAIAAVRDTIVFTTHTPVAAGNEVHGIDIIKRLGANCELHDAELERLGGKPFSMTVAGLRLSRKANAVAQLHGNTARTMWKHVEGGAPIVSITNGVHVPSWQDPRVRAALVPDKDEAAQRGELWRAHQQAKRELLELIAERGGVELRDDRLLIGFARRAAVYKRADLILEDTKRLEGMFADRRLQLVFAGKAHPADAAGKAMVARLVAGARRWPENVVFLENYDMRLGAALTRGCDVWLNNPRRPMEASGTSGMKAAMNGVLNASILDGWWPEGCVHGETGWAIGEEHEETEHDTARRDQLDRDAAYHVLAYEVMPRYYEDRERWITMMQNSIAMASWRFSSDRMLQDYYRELYTRSS
jgi:glycogen phosphorylase